MLFRRVCGAASPQTRRFLPRIGLPELHLSHKSGIATEVVLQTHTIFKDGYHKSQLVVLQSGTSMIIIKDTLLLPTVLPAMCLFCYMQWIPFQENTRVKNFKNVGVAEWQKAGEQGRYGNSSVYNPTLHIMHAVLYRRCIIITHDDAWGCHNT